ncbi:peptidoglycan-binding domain-containing protein [Sphingosinicella rhizophila]|uniref:Peptidoglycan-binding domain-containing protein n=1 Tax=Sphingosinicella rhizophila TaxID=3050082 RepID=A0ABU3Q6F3_9SPHN|nr:peptidoglycan-binding domain-containing protein [Sphingosinicella sp. GR2756]MDT9598987.1 peptidoglycan-binding domain-containing protein [Sphingosinicella sp. GR2756]
MLARTYTGGLILFLCLALLFLASAASAGTKEGQFAVEDSGRVTCTTYTKASERKDEAYHRYVGFLEGYLTAANRYEPNTFDLTPWHSTAAIALIVNSHCGKNPKDNLAMAAQRLVIAMAPVRLATFSKLIEVGEVGEKAVIYATILKRAQSTLARKGLYRGEANGEFNPEFRTALAQFQTLAKLDPTGLPDTATLWVLLNP